uniref:Uncharacterized protein n=1 Tax=Glossina palpalis gambiensis TaxID=67801 RepID=A0A1B0C6Z1_9MUSC
MIQKCSVANNACGSFCCLVCLSLAVHFMTNIDRHLKSLLSCPLQIVTVSILNVQKKGLHVKESLIDNQRISEVRCELSFLEGVCNLPERERDFQYHVTPCNSVQGLREITSIASSHQMFYSSAKPFCWERYTHSLGILILFLFANVSMRLLLEILLRHLNCLHLYKGCTHTHPTNLS